jgi:hypothetical protein
LEDVRRAGPDLSALRTRIGTFDADGRKSIVDLYAAQCEMEVRKGWILEEVFREEVDAVGGGRVGLPCNSLRTARTGPAVWILAGIHGEEPAGPNALAASAGEVARLARKGIPIVMLPLLNPLGYQRNWRYPDAERYSASAPGASVGDSEHLLPDDSGRPRRAEPACRQSGLLAGRLLDLARAYPPVLTLNLHEDNLLEKGYIYSQGGLGAEDPAALSIVELFVSRGFPLLLEGTTRFGEAVRGGVVSAVKDGSIDELLGSTFVVPNGVKIKGPSGGSVLVLETSSMRTSLPDRVKVHAGVLSSLETLWLKALGANRRAGSGK